MNKCKDIIYKIINSEKHDNQEDVSETIIRALRILQLVIENSESDSSSNIKSHQCLRKKYVKYIKAITLTIKLTNCYLNVYANTTIWELKNLISKKCHNVHPDLIQIFISRLEIGNSDNNKTVHDLIKGEDIRIDLINYEPMIERVDLVNKNGEVVPELIAIFESWFDLFKSVSEDLETNEIVEKIGINELIRLIKKTTQVYEDIDAI